jgi:subtilisin family serine protease
MAPGVNITSTSSPNGGYTQMKGTSFAAPLVTGAIALLWSIMYSKVTAPEILRSMTGTIPHRAIVPLLLDAYRAYENLKNNCKPQTFSE